MPATDTAARPSARDRLLAAADELFYAEGVHTVGIDRVIERAGVAKATLYSTFGSKDGLVRAYLEGRHAERRDRVLAHVERHTDPRERALAPFDALDDRIAQPGFQGCAFVNASAEADEGTAATEVSREVRAWTRALFTELATAAGAAEPAAVGRQLHLLYDGATLSARMDREADAARAARAAAAGILDAAIVAGAVAPG
ncbi:TetR/AcrR family transcriptional regulator [Aquihabitans sp. G128]|uniref:TetR/AcrR family transcriptional regulator n=1 Tax=Aquihabitans sp. G128 TaxID=2849779 RepID=UPI001C2464D4|nr:TetR/AcrR family transcriptional regulator [Aquihabitans sp. G128]QXC59224.1 TetR/AcrR family transcriptional regulator [Aquihabitans sp. G128]